MFLPGDPAFAAHPYPAYEQLRRGPRVQHDERTARWLVPRHADVEALQRLLPRLDSSRRRAGLRVT